MQHAILIDQGSFKPFGTNIMNNSIVWGIGISANAFGYYGTEANLALNYSNVEGIAASALLGNSMDDPLFMDTTVGIDDYSLKSWSPLRDSGSNALVPGTVTTDLAGNSRIIDGDGIGGAIVDMGRL